MYKSALEISKGKKKAFENHAAHFAVDTHFSAVRHSVGMYPNRAVGTLERQSFSGYDKALSIVVGTYAAVDSSTVCSLYSTAQHSTRPRSQEKQRKGSRQKTLISHPNPYPVFS